MRCPGCGSFGEFEIVLRFDLVERSGGGAIRQRHLVGEFEHVAVAAVAAGSPARTSPHRGPPAWRRCRPGCCSQPALALQAAAAAGRRRLAAAAGLAGCAAVPTAECRSSPAPWLPAPPPRAFPASRSCRGGGFLGGRRLCLIVGDDAPDRRQNLLHRGFLDLCRLRHLRLHIINAFACVVLHQARQDLPVPDRQAGIFIAQA